MHGVTLSDEMMDQEDEAPSREKPPRRSLRDRARSMAARLGESSAWRGYWPETLDYPWLRLIAACVIAPALLSLAAAAIHAAFFYATGPMGVGKTPGLLFSLDDHGIEAFHDYVGIFYRATVVWFIPSFVILVMADLRSRRAYGVLALIAATVDFAIAALINGAPMPILLFGTSILYPPLFLLIRSVSGIGWRAPPTRRLD